MDARRLAVRPTIEPGAWSLEPERSDQSQSERPTIIDQQAIDTLRVVAVKDGSLDAVLSVDHEDTCERDRILSAGDPVRVEHELIGHFPVRAQHGERVPLAACDP